MSKLSMRSVVKQFGSFTAVENFTLDLDAGKFLALLGPSGCGKTTMLRTIAGFEQPSGGTIHLDGRLLSSATLNIPPEHRNMSMIFQSYAVWPNMTVAQNVGFGLKIRKVDTETARKKVARMLEMVRLAPLANRYPAELSGGQQQRVALARALVIDPEVLLLDEPLSNLDASLRDEMRGEIRRIHDELQTTSIYVTHDQGEAISTADIVVVMNRGRIEQIGAPDRIFNFPETRFVAEFIGHANVLSGRVNGGAVDFAGFSVPTAALPSIVGQTISCALRAHTITLHPEPIAADPPAVVIPGRVTRRTYYGEYRSFQIQPEHGGDEKPLLVFCGPAENAEIGSRVHLRIDASKLVVLRD